MDSGKRSHRLEKLARIYDHEIWPIWSKRFGRMALRDLEVPPKAMILEVGCRTGGLTFDLLKKLDDRSRLIAIDSSSALLDVARKKAGALSGKRVFFRTESAQPRLTFANDVYDMVFSNISWSDFPEPPLTLRDFARVTRPGGQVVCTLPLWGTWGEFFDIYNEVLVKHDRSDVLDILQSHINHFPRPADLAQWMDEAGLEDPRIEVQEFSLLFKSAREFFFAPVVEFGPLAKWKVIAGKGRAMQDIFWEIKESIDAYFGGRAFQITVKAGCIRGTKVERAEDELPAEEEWLDVDTGEVEMLGDDDELEPGAEELDVFRDDKN